VNLNVGCGNHYAEGWVNVDIDHTDEVRPDVVADATKGLPFGDGEAERIYLGHVLEHIEPLDALVALAECRRVLVSGGEMCVVGPDCDIADRLLATGSITVGDHGAIVNGAGRWTHDVHLWRSTGARTEDFLRAAGFVTHPITIAELVVSTWPLVSGVDWQFSVLAS
jgi:predicted SAM-dependent methyltransferase